VSINFEAAESRPGHALPWAQGFKQVSAIVAWLER
jgi:hypothetical protein